METHTHIHYIPKMLYFVIGDFFVSFIFMHCCLKFFRRSKVPLVASSSLFSSERAEIYGWVVGGVACEASVSVGNKTKVTAILKAKPSPVRF